MRDLTANSGSPDSTDRQGLAAKALARRNPAGHRQIDPQHRRVRGAIWKERTFVTEDARSTSHQRWPKSKKLDVAYCEAVYAAKRARFERVLAERRASCLGDIDRHATLLGCLHRFVLEYTEL